MQSSVGFLGISCRLADVQTLAFRHGGLEFLLDFSLGLIQHILGNPVSSLGIIPSRVLALPAAHLSVS